MFDYDGTMKCDEIGYKHGRLQIGNYWRIPDQRKNITRFSEEKKKQGREL
jgi:hypothetical protein